MPDVFNRHRFDEFLALIDEPTRAWLRGRDFGQPWDDDRLDPIRWLARHGQGMANSEPPRKIRFQHAGLATAYGRVEAAAVTLIEIIDDLEPDARSGIPDGPERASADAAATTLTTAIDDFIKLGGEVLSTIPSPGLSRS